MKMNYFVLGTNNLEASTRFYNRLFDATEFHQTFSTDRMSFWQGEDVESAFAIALPFNGKAATFGNGTMIGFTVENAKEVSRLYELAIQLGGRCEGEPKIRGPRFSAYARDLDNNKLCFGSLL
ncbi:VOC family protein [Pseudoalteromonas luteoviolacea]|nr:VOC family protein [Pseudoalteromonas luteoviolacea]